MAKTEFDELMAIGINIGKDTFHLVGFHHDGQRVFRKQIKRLALIATFETLPRCIFWDGSVSECAFCQPHPAQDGF